MQYKIIVDKQPSSNPSDEKKEYKIDIEELRVKGDVYDSLNIELNRTYVTRRLSLSEYGVLSVLEEPVIEELTEVNIELFEGDNYIYLSDMQGNNFYAEYLIKNDFNDIYATKNEMNSAITQTAQSIELNVNQRLEGYNETVESEGTLEVNKSDIDNFKKIEIDIRNEIANSTRLLTLVIENEEDKVEYPFNLGDINYSFLGDDYNYDKIEIEKNTDGQYDVVITKQAQLNPSGIIVGMTPTVIYNQSLNIVFNEGTNYISLKEFPNSKIKLEIEKSGYATVYEMNSAITQTANEINLEVSKKVDDEELTGANITLRINEDTSEATINADKININGAISANGNFEVDTDGNMKCTNGTFNGGKITLLDNGEQSDAKLEIESNNAQVALWSLGFNVGNSSGFNGYIHHNNFAIQKSGNNDRIEYGIIGDIVNPNNQEDVSLRLFDSDNNETELTPTQITTPKLTQTSLESIKKNISKFTKNATDIINNSDIYEYNLKSDKDEDKKLIGFVIGENYKTPDEVIDKNGQAVSLYSAIGILWKAVQELSARVEQLEKEAQHE